NQIADATGAMAAGYRAEDDYDYLFKVVLIGDSGVAASPTCSPASPATSSASSPSPPSGSSSPPAPSRSTARSSRPRFGTPPARNGTRHLPRLTPALSLLPSARRLVDLCSLPAVCRSVLGFVVTPVHIPMHACFPFPFSSPFKCVCVSAVGLLLVGSRCRIMLRAGAATWWSVGVASVGPANGS
uniref:Uncharacterized protein n=1 Tax=Aegilops tauschii subsp. strangulata TaxID=200361 RepID=A0A453SEN5_AEGTS